MVLRRLDILIYAHDGRGLGNRNMEQLQTRFGMNPVECGYVSRLTEVHKHQKRTVPHDADLAGTVSIPWLGESTFSLIVELAEAL
jgi:hypothetical protein